MVYCINKSICINFDDTVVQYMCIGIYVLFKPYIFLDVVGGIYTVIRSKAAVTTSELGDQYCMIGPYNESCVRLEVEVVEPDLSVMKESIEALRKDGVKVNRRVVGYGSSLVVKGNVS